MLVHQLSDGDVTNLAPEAALAHFASCAIKSRNWSRSTIQPAYAVASDIAYNIALRAQVKVLEKRIDNLKVANPPAASFYTCAWCGICDSHGECENFYNKPMTMEEVDFMQGGYPFNQQGYQHFRAMNVGDQQFQHSYLHADFYNLRVEDYT